MELVRSVGCNGGLRKRWWQFVHNMVPHPMRSMSLPSSTRSLLIFWRDSVYVVAPLVLFLLPSQLQAQSDSTYCRTRTEGPFMVGKFKTVSVFAKITRVHQGDLPTHEWLDSDTSAILVDSANRRLYSVHDVPMGGSGDRRYQCKQLYFPLLGNVIAFKCSSAPSYPGDDESFRVFGLDSRSRFIDCAGDVPQEPLRIVYLDSRNRIEPVIVDSASKYAQPFFETIDIIYGLESRAYYAIHPNGVPLDADAQKLRFQKLPVFVDSKAARRDREYSLPHVKTVVLYLKPHKDLSKTLQLEVRRDSRVEFLDLFLHNIWWLHVTIDGHKGYVDHDGAQILGATID